MMLEIVCWLLAKVESEQIAQNFFPSNQAWTEIQWNCLILLLEDLKDIYQQRFKGKIVKKDFP